MLQLIPGGFLKEVAADTSPVLGGDLDGGGFDISNVGQLTLSFVDPQDDDVLFNIYSEDYGDDIIRIEKHISSGGYCKFVSPQGWIGFQSLNTIFRSSGNTNFQLEGGIDGTYQFRSYRGNFLIEARQYGEDKYDIMLNVGNTEVMRLDGATLSVGFRTDTPTALVDINSDILRLRTAKTPASAGAAGNAGDICWDASFVYVCVATNTWERTALSSW